MFNPTNIQIDLSALIYNLRKIKTLIPQSKVLAMIKCNAYGHGAVEVARKIESEVAVFGVMYLQEAIQLYEAGVKKPIVIHTGFFDQEELRVIDKFGFACVIHNFEQIRILEKCKLSQPLHVWFKIDTGMHRLGFQKHQVRSAYERLMAHSLVHKPLYLMTHFSDADNVCSNRTLEQLALFTQLIVDLEGEWCIANSAAILHWPKTHGAWIRPGILLYGAYPNNTRTALDFGFRPVMTFASYVVAIHELAQGETIGYGSTYCCQQDMRVGIVAVGYGDGYPRNAQAAPILIDGIRTKLLGRVAMDMVSVDLSHIPTARIGSKVVLWGEGLPVEEVAECCGEVAYELFTRVTSKRAKYSFCGEL